MYARRLPSSTLTAADHEWRNIDDRVNLFLSTLSYIRDPLWPTVVTTLWLDNGITTHPNRSFPKSSTFSYMALDRPANFELIFFSGRRGS